LIAHILLSSCSCNCHQQQVPSVVPQTYASLGLHVLPSTLLQVQGTSQLYMVLQVCTPVLPAFTIIEPAAALHACITAEQQNRKFHEGGQGQRQHHWRNRSTTVKQLQQPALHEEHPIPTT
jgi:hypothetical protein